MSEYNKHLRQVESSSAGFHSYLKTVKVRYYGDNGHDGDDQKGNYDLINKSKYPLQEVHLKPFEALVEVFNANTICDLKYWSLDWLRIASIHKEHIAYSNRDFGS